MKMITKTLLYLFLTVSIIFSTVSCGDTTNYAEVGQQFDENMNVLLEQWYSNHNPSHDPNGSQPTEEELRKMRIAARKKLDEIYKPEKTKEVQSKMPYSEAELFFKEKDTAVLPTVEDTFKSEKFDYEIIIPTSFVKKQPKGEHIDFNFANNRFSTIVANVSPKKTIDPPISESFLNTYKTLLQERDSNLVFLKSSVININNNTGMMTLQLTKNNGILLKSIEFYFYNRNNVYIITASSPESDFDSLEKTFFETVNSLTFL